MSESGIGSPAERVIALYAILGTWRKVGEELDVSPGMAHRVAGGYEPKDPAIRRRLGFPAIEYIPQVRNTSGRFSSKEKRQ